MEKYTIARTRELDLCLSCEICLSVCPVEAITMDYSRGQFLPLVDTEICTKCQLCLDACPGIDIYPIEMREYETVNEIIRGSFLKSYTASSKDSKIRKKSTSGGLITTLVRELIDKNEYDGAFILDFTKFNNTPARLKKTNNIKIIVKSAKSKYIPVSVFDVINELKKKNDQKYIIIGTSCQLFGIKKYINKYELAEKKHLFLGLFCSSTLNFNFLRFIEEHYSKRNENIEDFCFRTKEKFGWPGHMKVVFDSGRTSFLDRSIRINLTKIFKLNRCLFCFDKLNRYADISFGDCYIKNKSDTKGNSSVIVRTGKGMEIFEKFSYLFDFATEEIENIWQSQNIQAEKQDLLHAKLLIKEKSLYPDYKKDYQIKQSVKKSLNQQQRLIRLGQSYSSRKIKFKLEKALYLLSVKKLLMKTVQKTWKILLPIAILLKAIVINQKNVTISPIRQGKNIIIINGKFFNEGAQSMSLIALDQIKKRFDDVQVYHFSNNYKDIVRARNNPEQYFLKLMPWTMVEQFRFLGKPFDLMNPFFSVNRYFKEINSIFANAKFIIDLSGYAISSEIRPYVWIPFILNLMVGKKYSIPYYIFPQSIGPFNFSLKERLPLFTLLKSYLKYPRIIFVREKEGYNSLIQFTRQNVKLSHDVVLQHEISDYSNVLRTNSKATKVKLQANSIGIVPNLRVLIRSQGKDIDKLYKNMIELALNSKKIVYLLNHSQQDLTYCKRLKSLFPENEDVILLSGDYNSIELEEFIMQFDFIIASRYHSIVHAYKNGVPTIVIGWATKYSSLLSEFEQLRFYFDIRREVNDSELMESLSYMLQNHDNESKIIISKMKEIKVQKSPFDVFDEFNS